jgi:hypothetical protein
MKSYALTGGDTLVFSVDGGAWETITFAAADFADVGAATADELASVLNRSETLAASVDENDCLVLKTASKGGHTSLTIDLARSTAAAALGLAAGQGHAQGAGLESARLVSAHAAPFRLPAGAQMSVVVDGQRRRFTFETEITPGRATATEVVDVLNAKLKRVARVTRDSRVMLTSPSVGPGSRLEVEGPRPDSGKPDAAAILGFAGAVAVSQPYRAEPARLLCSGQVIGVSLVNLTAGPIELHLTAGPAVLPARGTIPLAAGDAASETLQRLIEQGAVRLGPQAAS